MGCDLENQEKYQDHPGLYDKRTAQEIDKIRHIHGIAGKTVQSVFVKAVLRGRGKAYDGQNQQHIPQGIHRQAGGQQPLGCAAEPAEQQADENCPVGELIQPVRRSLPSLQRGKIGGAPDGLAVQLGQQAKAEEKKGYQQQSAHDSPSPSAV